MIVFYSTLRKGTDCPDTQTFSCARAYTKTDIQKRNFLHISCSLRLHRMPAYRCGHGHFRATEEGESRLQETAAFQAIFDLQMTARSMPRVIIKRIPTCTRAMTLRSIPRSMAATRLPSRSGPFATCGSSGAPSRSPDRRRRQPGEARPYKVMSASWAFTSSRRGSRNGGSCSVSPSSSLGSSWVKPGGSVAISMLMPLGVRKYTEWK